MSCVERILTLYGGTSATARVMKLDRQHVHSWKKRGYIPPKYAHEIERITKGEIKAKEILDEAVKFIGRGTTRESREG